MSWDLVGEDYDAIAHHGHLPLDWHTKAKALLGCDLGRFEAAEWLPLSKMQVVHGWLVKAPPGEWWGSDYYTWTDKLPADEPDGWRWTDEDHQECAGSGYPCSYLDEPGVLCLGFDSWPADDSIAVAARDAGPEVVAIAVGEGWPWLCRQVGPVTIVTCR